MEEETAVVMVAFERTVDPRITVHRIENERMPDHFHVLADLVLAAGFYLELHKGNMGKRDEYPIVRNGIDKPLVGTSRKLLRDGTGLGLQITRHERAVRLLPAAELTLANLLHDCRALRKNQHPRRRVVEPMDDPEPRIVLVEKVVQRCFALSRRGYHKLAAQLIDDQEVLVLVQNTVGVDGTHGGSIEDEEENSCVHV